MKFIKYLIALVAITPLLGSCLHSNLDELPSYSDSKIKSLKAEFRFKGPEIWAGEPVVEFVVLPATQTADDKALTVDATFTVPAAKDNFTTEVRNTVSLKNIAVMANLSIATRIAPLNNAPQFGVPADWSASPYKYEVTAADGSKSTWTIKVALKQ